MQRAPCITFLPSDDDQRCPTRFVIAPRFIVASTSETVLAHVNTVERLRSFGPLESRSFAAVDLTSQKPIEPQTPTVAFSNYCGYICKDKNPNHPVLEVVHTCLGEGPFLLMR